VSFPKICTALLLAAALCACSGRHNDQASTGSQTQSSQNEQGVMTGSPAPAVNNATPVGASTAGNGGSMVGVAAVAPSGSPAPVPANLSCGSAQPVWVNQRSHSYHEPSDPYYGRTKHGSYMCLNDAVAAGYHPAGKGGHHHHGMMGSPEPAAT
jgi:hypothetical protein